MDERQFNAFMARLAEMLQGVRQYIGARYVPHFLDDPWNDTTQYEALDVVDNGMGTSYIAKKPVPPGTPLTNREFWFLYGSTSGAIINLQNQIDTIVNTTIPGINSEIQDLTNNAAMKSELNYITPQKFGAVGDGVNDDTVAIKQALAYGETNYVAVFLPKGQYKVTDDLGEYSDITFFGTRSIASSYSESVIYDCRPKNANKATRKPLLKVAGKYYLHDINFSNYFADDADHSDRTNLNKDCLQCDGGWDAIVRNVLIQTYYLCGLYVTGEDIIFENVFALGCGEKYTSVGDDPIYAVMLAGNVNVCRFSNCHFEHCRYMLYIGGTSHANVFDGCHLEHSDSDLSDNYANKCAIVITINAHRNFFTNCIFACPSTAQMNAQNTLTQMIGCAGDRNSFIGCSFATGSGGAQYFYSQYRSNIVIGCIFQNCSVKDPIWLGADSIFSDNILNYVDDSAVVGSDILLHQSSAALVTNNVFNTDGTHHNFVKVKPGRFIGNIVDGAYNAEIKEGSLTMTTDSGGTIISPLSASDYELLYVMANTPNFVDTRLSASGNYVFLVRDSGGNLLANTPVTINYAYRDLNF